MNNLFKKVAGALLFAGTFLAAQAADLQPELQVYWRNSGEAAIQIQNRLTGATSQFGNVFFSRPDPVSLAEGPLVVLAPSINEVGDDQTVQPGELIQLRAVHGEGHVSVFRIRAQDGDHYLRYAITENEDGTAVPTLEPHQMPVVAQAPANPVLNNWFLNGGFLPPNDEAGHP